MEDWQKRVVEERDGLAARIGRLQQFMQRDTFSTVSAEDRRLLQAQYGLMVAYEHVLNKRIARFEQEAG